MHNFNREKNPSLKCDEHVFILLKKMITLLLLRKVLLVVLFVAGTLIFRIFFDTRTLLLQQLERRFGLNATAPQHNYAIHRFPFPMLFNTTMFSDQQLFVLLLFPALVMVATSSSLECPNNSDCGGGGDGVTVGLSGIPETAVWILHNRASGASDPTKDWFRDDKAIEIYSSIGDYDFEGTFGKPDEGSSIRGWLYDQQVLEFWKDHPDGTVVSFAEGLETHRFRLEKSRSPESLWVTVDLPEMIEVRERFITPDEKNLHVAASVLDTREWMKFVPKDKPVFFIAQGLVMYLEEDAVRGLFQSMANDFPSSTMIFDLASKWLSDRAMSPDGWKLTDSYKVPKMPFGVNKDKAVGLVSSWVPSSQVEEVQWPLEKNTGFFVRYIAPILLRIPFVQNLQPGMVMKIAFPPIMKQ